MCLSCIQDQIPFSIKHSCRIVQIINLEFTLLAFQYFFNIAKYHIRLILFANLSGKVKILALVYKTSQGQNVFVVLKVVSSKGHFRESDQVDLFQFVFRIKICPSLFICQQLSAFLDVCLFLQEFGIVLNQKSIKALDCFLF